MAVYRVQRTRDYTVMSNYHLKDKGLTLKSKGLLSMILSLPEESVTAKEVYRPHRRLRFTSILLGVSFPRRLEKWS